MKMKKQPPPPPAGKKMTKKEKKEALDKAIQKMSDEFEGAVDGFLFWDHDWELEPQLQANPGLRAYMDIEDNYFDAQPSVTAARALYPDVAAIEKMIERVQAHLDAEAGNGWWTEERYKQVSRTAREARCQGKAPEPIRYDELWRQFRG